MENNTTIIIDIIDQEEDVFVPNLVMKTNEESDIEDSNRTQNLGIIQQKEETIYQQDSSRSASEPNSRTECENWVIDINQSPKLGFVENIFEY